MENGTAGLITAEDIAPDEWPGVLQERVRDVRRKLEEASEGRYPVPKLIAVTKTHSADLILPLRECGVRAIGENRVQEIVQKRPFLAGNFQIHLIGRLQSNKVKYIINDVCLIHSLDRLSLAQEIDRQALKQGCVMDVLVQVSPAGEEQKGGMAPEDVPAFLRTVSSMQGLHVRGLMAVMPHTEDEDYLLGLFGGMRSLFDRMRSEAISGINMEELSMGMSGDYLLAARCGATMVRVGSALFGPRSYPAAV